MSIFTGLSILIHVKGGEGVSRCGLVRVGFSGHAKCVRFYMWFQLPLSEEIFRNLTKKRTFYLKPQTTSKFEKICHPKTLRNRKPHIKPHFKGTKTANRTRNRISKSLKPQPATHCTPHPSRGGGDVHCQRDSYCFLWLKSIVLALRRGKEGVKRTIFALRTYWIIP